MRCPSIARWTLLLVLVGALSSCARQESTEQTSTAPTDQTTTTTTPTVDDAQIAAIVVAANQADVENGKLAQSKSNNAEVKSFADMMVRDHSASNEKTKALATRLNVTPQESDASRTLSMEADATRSSLASMAGTNFDRAYVDAEVAFHEKVLNSIDQMLIPSAQNAEVKQLLTETRPTVAMHLEHARQLQTKLSGVANRP